MLPSLNSNCSKKVQDANYFAYIYTFTVTIQVRDINNINMNNPPPVPIFGLINYLHSL